MDFKIEHFDKEDNLLTFYVEVTRYFVQKPMGKWVDSEWGRFNWI